MKSFMILITFMAFMTFLPLPGLAEESPVPRLIDDDGPSLGVRTLVLKELWRVGGEDEDVLFGRIVDVQRHPNGEVYILDNQMCQVVVISGDGEHLRDLSRQGDGPGEIRQPMGLVFCRTTYWASAWVSRARWSPSNWMGPPSIPGIPSVSPWKETSGS